MNGNHKAAEKKSKLIIKAGSEVIRTWKRDGTKNVMGLGVAAYNLINFYPILDVQQIADSLIKGEIFETPYAIFKIKEDDFARGAR